MSAVLDPVTGDQATVDAPCSSVAGHDPSAVSGHQEVDPQWLNAADGKSPRADHGSLETQSGLVGPPPPPAINGASSNEGTWAEADALLAIFADALDDLERVRIATENRVRSLVQVKGMEGTPEQERLAGLVEALQALEHGATLDLKRALRKHPLGPWVKATIGVGEKQGARLLAAIGNPYVRPALFDADGTLASPAQPRTVSQLWAYCGYHVLRTGQLGADTQRWNAGADPSGQRCTDTHGTAVGGEPSGAADQSRSDTHQRFVGGANSCDPGHGRRDDHTSTAGVAPSRKRGQKANWNSTAKMRTFLIAEAAVKAGVRKIDDPDDSDGYDLDHRTAVSPHGQVYLDGRAKYADAVHQVECRRCGPSGKPAAVGSDLSDGHKHARALRLVAKAILKDLWLEARRLHSEAS